LLSGVKDSLQHGEVRCAEEEVTQIHTHTHTDTTHTQIHTQTHTHTHPHLHTDTHTIQTYIHTPHTHTHTNTHTHTHTHTTHTYTQTHTHRYTHRHTHTHCLPTTTDHHTAAVHKTMSQLCDGIQCRLTAGTAGSSKGEILVVQLGKGQTDWVKKRKTFNKIGEKISCKLSLRTGYTVYKLWAVID